MAETIIGLSKLEHRLAAISVQHSGKKFMTLAGGVVRGRMIKNMRDAGARKTGTTAGSLHVSNVTDTSAVVTGNKVARWIDEGTGLYGPHHQKITPKAAKALRWIGGPASSKRLSGRARSGKAGAGAGAVFARSVKGMKARPYVAKSVREAGQQLGVDLKAEILKDWNSAA